jgi:tRNA threonylcarbamoyladenosine biosynthesis protein TsaB
LKVLAFDTSSSATVVGLMWGEGSTICALDRRQAGERPGHQERMLPLAFELLERARIELSAIERIAVGIGPGTFTGLRVGIATARALAQALECAIVPICSLQALALGAPRALGAEGAAEEGPVAVGEVTVLPITDARRGELFAAAYELKGADQQSAAALAERRIAPCAIAPDALGQLIARARALSAGRTLVAVGDGALTVAERLRAEGVIVPSAASAAHLIGGCELARLGAVGSALAPLAVLPEYCRAPDAQIAAPRGVAAEVVVGG